jgi:Family of unknown function (DUF5681)
VDKKKPFLVGYGKPPQHTRFKPGQSGNPSGRPKRRANLFEETFEKELNTRITVTEAGKQLKITKLHAIVKQQTNKAITGDSKAAVLVMKAVEPRQADPIDNLSPVLAAMRAIHAKHEVASQSSTRGTAAADVTIKEDDEHD